MKTMFVTIGVLIALAALAICAPDASLFVQAYSVSGKLGQIALGAPVAIPDQIQMLASGSSDPSNPPLEYRIELDYQDQDGAAQSFTCHTKSMCSIKVPDASRIKMTHLRVDELVVRGSKEVTY